jgi:Cu2+-exporting ATPase
VHREKGASVYAGTVLEEGELTIAATRVGGDTRINSILKTIEESESVKASIQGRYERMADAIVPYSFLLSGAVFALTRNLARAGAVLLVDYSCAIRLATPLSIVTAMREAAARGILIKGGKYMEAIAEADVMVFDKTGTLTRARPELVDVIPFGALSRSAVLRLAACLEEHFVHPVGQAVVRASEAEGLRHREEHATVSYIVAHGIASTWNERRVLVGSGHFVLEDEGIRLTPAQEARISEEADKGRSLLYVSVGAELAGILLIEDRIRDDAARVVQALRDDGVKRVIMLTGDSERTAASIARRAGITEYRSQMLPAEKAAFIAALKKRGGRIAMIGDGINDSPALSAAHVGVAMAGGADMAREIADIVLVNAELRGLLTARAISRAALKRVRKGVSTSLLLNSVFLAGGLLGFLRPGLSALLHNATTAGMAMASVQPIDLERKDSAQTEERR